MNRIGQFLQACCIFWAMSASGQRAGVIQGVISDPSGAPVPGARLTLRGMPPREILSGAQGEFSFAGLPAGTVTIHCEMAGFRPVTITAKVMLSKPQTLQIRLAIEELRAEIEVAAEESGVSSSAARNADAISVERGLLDKLPILDNNFIAALGRFLDPGMPGGSGISLVVDGMEMRNTGVTASAIQEIRINNNPYTVEYPRWSRRRIEIITKSSADAYHGTLNSIFRDYHMNARDPFARTRPQEQRRIWEGSLFGPVGRSKKTSFLLSGAREEDDLVGVVVAQGPLGPVNENVPTPAVNTVGSLRVSRQFNEKQAMFWQVNFQDRWQNNLGAGGATLREAATQARFREDEFVVNHRAVLSTSLLSQFRLLVGRYWSPTRSNQNAVKILVTDAFIGGGAQADRLATEFHASLTWLLTQTTGKHTLKYGLNIPDWSRRGLSDRSNQLGTVSYGGLQALAAGTPFATVIQRGDPRLIFVEKTVGAFLQDEWQLRPGLSLAAGLRYDWQNYFGDGNNFAPRLALAWAPGKKRQTVIRAGGGFFFDRSGPGPIWDILRFDGSRLRRFVIPAGFLGNPDNLPASVHRLDRDIALPNTMQFSLGVERQLAAKTTLAVNYVGVRGVQQLRSRDGNAPLPPGFGARPDSAVNVLRIIEAAGRVAGNSLEVSLRGDFGKRVNGMAQYVFGKTMANTGGVNWFPADSYGPSGEWGRADSDRRQQLNFLGSATFHRWAKFGLSLALLSGLPYNVTTGRDENGDGMALDRPVGVARNTGKGPGTAIVDLRWYREFALRPKLKEKGPGLTLSLDAFNVLNRVNSQNFVGALSSPFFGRAVATLPARRLQAGLRLQF
jgi:hypothetical protein